MERRGADGSPAGIEGALEYASDLFDRSSVEAIAGRLVRLLEGAVADPERAIGRLDILGADERHTILREWNATARAAPGATLPDCSRRRLRARLTRTRWCSRTSGSATASSMRARAGAEHGTRVGPRVDKKRRTGRSTSKGR